MSKLIFEYDETGKGIISAFAFNTGHLIETLINEQNDNLNDRIKLNEAKILGFYQELKEPSKSKYAEYFGIKRASNGKM